MCTINGMTFRAPSCIREEVMDKEQERNRIEKNWGGKKN